MNAGIASAARMPRIATTIISSMRVKPDFFFSSFDMIVVSDCLSGGAARRTTNPRPSSWADFLKHPQCTRHASVQKSCGLGIAAVFRPHSREQRRSASLIGDIADKKRQSPMWCKVTSTARATPNPQAAP
jgi:hypothetical protein